MRPQSTAILAVVLAFLVASCTPKSAVRISGDYTIQAIAAEGK